MTLTNCSNQTCQDASVQRELIPNPEKYEHDGYSNLADTLKPIFLPDTTIGHISLVDTNYINSCLGDNSMDRLTKVGETDDLPHLSILSSDKKQLMTLYFHPGSVVNEFSEFKVSYNNGSNQKSKAWKEKEFETENGIKLGITIGDLKSIKGDPDRVTKKEITCFHYTIADFEDSEFLKRYGYPSYYADYKFKDGYLIEFRFGFEYP